MIPPETLALLGSALGALAGMGLWSLMAVAGGEAALSDRHSSSIQMRVALALRDVSPEARAVLHPRASDPVSVWGVVAGPSVLRLSEALSRILGESEAASRQIARAGWAITLEQYRLHRMLSAAGGAAVGLVASVWLTWHSPSAVAVGIVGAGLGAVLGVAVFDRQLRRAAEARAQRLIDEFPSVIELLAVALSAGESLPGAVSRIAERGSGELAGEFRRVMRRVEVGESFSGALRDSADTIGVPEIVALVEHLVSALERGAPLAEVVRAHSADSRAEGLRAIVDRAGKAEVWMLVPLVLLILPTTVIFAVWPSLQALQLGL